MSVKAKYLKYKKKYQLLKNQTGSGIAQTGFLRETFTTFSNLAQVPYITYGTKHDTNNNNHKTICKLITKECHNGDTSRMFEAIYNDSMSDHKIISYTNDIILIITFNVENISAIRKNIDYNLEMFCKKTKVSGSQKIGIPIIPINQHDFDIIIDYKNKYICHKLQSIINQHTYQRIYINLQECYPSLYIYLVKNLKVNDQYYFKPTKLINQILHEKINPTLNEYINIKPRIENISGLCTLIYDEDCINVLKCLHDFDDTSHSCGVDQYPTILHDFQNDPNNVNKFITAYPCSTYSQIHKAPTDKKPSAGAGAYHLICNGIYIKDYHIVNIHSKENNINHIKNIINSFTPLKIINSIYHDQTFKSFKEIDHSSHSPKIIDKVLDCLYESREEFETDYFFIAGDFNTILFKGFRDDDIIISDDIGYRKYTNLYNKRSIDNIILIGTYPPE